MIPAPLIADLNSMSLPVGSYIILILPGYKIFSFKIPQKKIKPKCSPSPGNGGMEKDLVNRQIKERNIPMLTLHTDYGQENIETLRNRIEPFLEINR